jgi:hypothetical protein
MKRILTELRARRATEENLPALLNGLRLKYKKNGLVELNAPMLRGVRVIQLKANSTDAIEGYRIGNNTKGKKIPLPSLGFTTAILSIDGKPNLDTRNSGQHAEEKLVGILEQNLGKRPARSVEILVSQSPCGERKGTTPCADRLINLKKKFPNTVFSVYYKTLHQGKGGEKDEASMAAIVRMRRAQIRTYLWVHNDIRNTSHGIQSPPLTFLGKAIAASRRAGAPRAGSRPARRP